MAAIGSEHRRPGGKLARRLLSVPALLVTAILLTLTTPVWLPLAVLADVVRLRSRLPLARLLAFGLCWTWIEVAGVAWSVGVWSVGRGKDPATHYRLMASWSAALMRALRWTIGIDPVLEGGEALAGGNVIVLSRHASLADSLLSAWAICCQAGLWPRYVLKRELLFDPCLDIVGLRVPNHFLDRQSNDGEGELDALRQLSAGVGPGVAAVIFPEGTRANRRKRERALARIAERDPQRARRLAGLQRLLPPRPSGAAALIEGAPNADVALAWHTGFDGLDTFGGMLSTLARPLQPVRFVVRRVPRADVPRGEAFVEWLDAQWLQMDAEVDVALSATTQGGSDDDR